MSTRSAGFSTVNQTILSPGSQWTFIILMFVGASPSSTAGGIRTTTLMIII
jgi:Trk-type K+ transport system membrane component